MRRGKERWTHADDKRLGRALLGVFTNHGEEVILSDSCALWKRVQQQYQDLLAAEQVVAPDITAAQRSARSLHTRWARGIRPDMTLFASLVDKMQKAGKKPAKAIKQATKLFRGRRSEINAEAVRQFVQERQRPPTDSGDSETDAARPKFKFESFHFRHCYDILCSNSSFMEALLEKSRTSRGNEPLKKHRPTEGASSCQEKYRSFILSDGSDVPDSHESEEQVTMRQYPPASQLQKEEVGSISREHPSNWQYPRATANAVNSTTHPSNVAQRDRESVFITLEDASDVRNPPRLECDRAVANEYVRLRMQALKDDRRLKLLAELRGVVATMSQLAQQLAWNGVASAALTARTGGVCPALDQDVLRDIAFFRHEKERLKQEIAANGTNSK
ncbi:hypothetical protein KXD40_008002 [Peronospora effusa]|uniref:Uncharacterized protein n=1 Tax=Peronospora effusa TaxID=542832 RepID=A0A3M6VCT7_9STRA|nr:hypothetical protein DD238_005236 [Peronospora effusa]RQM15090.1 hypothetical protein DD237_004413 [Peronospora effusa]UIZ23415.1 hypothetical protein KXD40_008002 [Peronospora effusa]